MKRLFLGLLVCVFLLAGCAKSDVNADKNSQVIGGDKDEHGCLIAAGYSWCEAKQKCLRVWEENCTEAVEADSGTPETPKEIKKLTIEEATEIAKKSKCIEEGELTNSSFYNENSDTWWIDIIPEKENPGCNPACVIYSEDKTTEINWRCTGLIAPE